MKTLSLLIAISLLSACGASNGETSDEIIQDWAENASKSSDSTSDPVSEQTANQAPNAFLVKPDDDYPDCLDENEGQLIYVLDESTFRYCDPDEGWLAIDLAGEDGADGKDGTDGRNGKDGKDGLDGQNGTNGKDGVDGKDGTDGSSGLAIDKIYEFHNHSIGVFESIPDQSVFTDEYVAWVSDVRLVYFTDGSFDLTVHGRTWDSVTVDGKQGIYGENFTHTYIGRPKDGLTFVIIKMFNYPGAQMSYAVGPSGEPSLKVLKDSDGDVLNNDWYSIDIELAPEE